MLLGLLREGLVSQLSHAGYLGGELAKAEAALRLGSDVRYEQDRPLRHQTPSSTLPAEGAPNTPTDQGGPAPSNAGASPMPAISIPQTWAQFQATPVGEDVNITLEVTAQPAKDLVEGMVMEPSEREPFSLFRRTEQGLHVQWSEATRIIMGEASQVQPAVLLRVRGKRRAEREIAASALVILTEVARIEE